MKNWLLLFLLIGSFTAFAQNVPPQAIAFQGVAIDPNGYPVPSMDEFGNPLRDEAIRIRFTIQDSDASSAVEHYSEEHAVVTDHYGRFSVEIGRGNSINANQFSDIIWSSGKKFLKVEIDLSGTGAQYELTSLQEMLSVPFALYAASAGNNADADADPTNEIQSLALLGNQLSLSSSNSVSLPDNDQQTLSVTGNQLTISNGNSVNLQDNDQQTLSMNGQSLSISNGNSVTIPANTDNQTLSVLGQTLSISNGNSILLPSVQLDDNDSTNELQNLTLSGSTLGLSKSSSTIDLSNLLSGTTGQSSHSDNLMCMPTGGIFISLENYYNAFSSTYVPPICLADSILVITVGGNYHRYNINSSTMLGPLCVQNADNDLCMNNNGELYLKKNNKLIVVNLFTNTRVDSVTNALLNYTGYRAMDPSNGNLVWRAGTSDLKKYTRSTNQVSTYTSASLPSGWLAERLYFIGQDSLVVGNELRNASSFFSLIGYTYPWTTSTRTNDIYYDRDAQRFIYEYQDPNNQNLIYYRSCNKLGTNITSISSNVGLRDAYTSNFSGTPSVKGMVKGDYLLALSTFTNGYTPNFINNFSFRETNTTYTFTLNHDTYYIQRFAPIDIGKYPFGYSEDKSMFILDNKFSCVGGTIYPDRGVIIYSKY